MRTVVQTTVPGSMMLFGEHAVLHGYPALVCAIDRHIRVRLTPDAERRVTLHSSLGAYESALDSLIPDVRFRFALTAVEMVAPALPGGFSLDIDSNFPGAIGLGTSAAVTVAVLGAISAWIGTEPTPHDLLNTARAVIRKVQGTGSGADAAASVFGGIVAFRECDAEPLGLVHPITVAYAGYKTPTPDVIRKVEATGRRYPELQAALFDAIGRTTAEAEAQLRTGNVDRIGELMNIGHGLMEGLGVCDARLSELAHRIRALTGVAGAKISGSGLGDCVVGWGRPAPLPAGEEWIPVAMAKQGMRVN